MVVFWHAVKMSHWTTVSVGALLALLNCLHIAQPVRIWKHFHMDRIQGCRREVRNDNMAINDFYVVKSDEFSGRSVQEIRRPAECTVVFNFGDRYAGAQVTDWKCSLNASRTEKELRYMKEVYVAIYDVCDGTRLPQNKLLAKVNCSDTKVHETVKSSTSCLTIYHYRGHVQHGYYFSVAVMARGEIIPFPVGGIAGIIVGSVVVCMILVKIVCVVTGYDRRLPEINIDVEEEKRILESYADPVVRVQTTGDQMLESYADPVLQVQTTESTAANDTQGPSTDVSDYPGQSLLLPADTGHRVLRVSRSASSATSAELSSDFDYEFLEAHEGPTNPRLKRYSSVRASSIWRHK